MFFMVLLTGPTGSGKTNFLQQLVDLGEQVIDLENLCNHRGSAFGGFNQPTQPIQADFNDQLLTAFNSFDPKRPVFVEQKGQSVGQLKMPMWFTQYLNNKMVIFLNVALRLRIEQVAETYQHDTDQQLREALNKMHTHLSPESLYRASKSLDSGNRYDFISEMIAYYDASIGYAGYYQAWDYCLTIETKDQYGSVLNDIIRLAYA